MPHPLHEKIEHALAQRGLLKRDLARALDVSPQTATDICKGRSAVTLPHLRRLVALFGLRADFWLDDERLAPSSSDEVAPDRDLMLRDLLATEVCAVRDAAAFGRRLMTFARERRDEFAGRFGDLADDERAAIGLPQRNAGRAGHIEDAIEVAS